MKQATEKLLKSKAKTSKARGKRKENPKREREKSMVNMCWLKNHNHAWSKYPNNPASKNFSGNSYTEIPDSERYEKDFEISRRRWPKKKKKQRRQSLPRMVNAML